MKNLLVLSIILINGFYCSASKNITDLENLKLKGKISFLKLSDYTAVDKFGNIEKDQLKRSINYSFDNKGYLLELLWKDSNFNKKTKYKYDLNNYRIEATEFDSNDNLLITTHFVYDNKYNLIEENQYIINNILATKSIHKYDQKGNRIQTTKYQINGNVESRGLFQYDELNNQIEYSSYNSDGNLTIKFSDKFDNKANKIESNLYSSKGIYSSIKYKYNEKSFLIEQNNYEADGSLSGTIYFKYDDKGNSTERTSSPNSSTKSQYSNQYEYDKNGNWIKMISFENGFPKTITEREIVYL